MDTVMKQALSHARTQRGETLAALADDRAVLLLFLRHFGCPFCRETVANVAKERAAIDASGTQVVFVHMHPEAQAAEYFGRYGVGDLSRVSDPGRQLYLAFGLAHVETSNWFRWSTLRRYLEAIFGGGHLPALVGGSIRQMPGAFLLVNGEVVKAFRHRSVGDRLDLAHLISTDVTASA